MNKKWARVKIKFLKGWKDFKRDDIADVHPALARSLIQKGVAIQLHITAVKETHSHGITDRHI